MSERNARARIIFRWFRLAFEAIRHREKQLLVLIVVPLLVSLISTSAAFITNFDASHLLGAASARDLFRDLLTGVTLVLAALQLAMAGRAFTKRPDPLLQLRKRIKSAYGDAIRAASER
jgi:hypothetical protein